MEPANDSACRRCGTDPYDPSADDDRYCRECMGEFRARHDRETRLRHGIDVDAAANAAFGHAETIYEHGEAHVSAHAGPAGTALVEVVVPAPTDDGWHLSVELHGGRRRHQLDWPVDAPAGAADDALRAALSAALSAVRDAAADAAANQSDDDVHDRLFALLDRWRCERDASPSRAALTAALLADVCERSVPLTGTTTLSSVGALDSLRAGAHLRLVAAERVADEAWRRGRDGARDIATLLAGNGALRDDHMTPAESAGIVRHIARRVPPLTGKARTRAASAVTAVQPDLARRTALNAIDARDPEPLTDASLTVLRAYATTSPAAGHAVARLAEAHGARRARSSRIADDADPTREGETVDVHFDAAHRITVSSTSLDWSSATVFVFDSPGTSASGGTDVPTGLRPDERDPDRVARALVRIAAGRAG